MHLCALSAPLGPFDRAIRSVVHLCALSAHEGPLDSAISPSRAPVSRITGLAGVAQW